MHQEKEMPSEVKEKKDPKESWSRNAKRESKRLDVFMQKLMITYINFYQMQANKESEELVKAFNELNKKWQSACSKKWGSIVPKKEAFANNIDQVLTNMKKVEKQRAETALKTA
jgi:hypothetical protein